MHHKLGGYVHMVFGYENFYKDEKLKDNCTRS